MANIKVYFILVYLFNFLQTPLESNAQSSEYFEPNRPCLENIELQIDRYADSLNYWKRGMNLPKFIFNPKLDQGFTFTNTCLRDGWIFSYRKLIIDRVLNADALLAVLKSTDPRLDSTSVIKMKFEGSERNYVMPYSSKSTRLLVQRKLDAIDYRKKLFFGKE